MQENNHLRYYILLGWASISGTLLVSSTEDGGPGLSPEYVHVSNISNFNIHFINYNS